ncbi:hypothetical protein PG989_009168 [Apiospora arundinis]
MRLFNCQTHALEEFLGNPPNKYAILSHMWETDEVTFQVYHNQSVEHETMKGWYKVRKACEQALEDGFEYLWADTLCIDKSSSSELSESINSMFKWYRDSAVCYAYLSDVASDGTEFEKSRWFSRGWTLQELIAPGELKFYGKSWDFIGLKSTMLDQLHTITTIDPTALQGGNLRLLSVAQKMSWASQRQTTRPEDIAYCLLGIFGISMPMLYGEGSRAFLRLQEQIVREYNDETLFAWRSGSINNDKQQQQQHEPPTGVFAISPDAFAGSANFYPCQPRWSSLKQFDPMTVSNRGVQFVAPSRKLDNPGDTNGLEDSVGRSDEVYHVQLACKEVGFDSKPRLRAGIYLAKPSGPGDTWSRVHPDELPPFASWTKYEVNSFFALKERSPLQELTLGAGAGGGGDAPLFWIRTLPTVGATWPYRLAFAHPSNCWDVKNSMFRWQRGGEQNPIVLAFRKSVVYSTADKAQNEDKDPRTPSSYFLVFLGIKEPEQPQAEDWSRQYTWCHIKYVEKAVLTAENVDLEMQGLDIGEIMAMSERRGDKWFHCEGDGWLLKCYLQMEVVRGHHLFCVDLHQREA